MAAEKLQKRLFGTNGVRGIVGKDMTPDLVLSIGLAFGSMRKGRIAVGRDSRTSGESLANAVKAGLMAAGCDVVDCGMLPTPALQYLVMHHFDGGAMITASHNPPEYNGVKIIEPDGTEMGDEQTVLLEERIFSRNFEIQSWEHVGSETKATQMVDYYTNAIIRSVPENIGNNLSVVVDPGCGAASVTTPKILTGLGCRVFSINAQVDGHFPGRLPEPSLEGLKGLAGLVRSTGSAFGVAHDGDADRAVFVDENGRFIEENQEFALVADYICSRRSGVVVTPVSSSLLVETIVKKHGGSVVYTPVGSIYVARTMRELLEKGENVVFGGEGNGGLIFPGHQFCRDGGMTATIMVAILAQSGLPLSKLIDQLPVFHMIKEKIQTDNPDRLINHLAESCKGYTIDRTDGLRITKGDAWALVRPSGTEPLVRVMVESAVSDSARKFYQELMGYVRQL
ncbi:MAG: phosphoglucosamine mutase [Methanoregulaceae archaeon]|jgi:phosphomannomutase/phosphoglucomutase|nr:phosphoglucosamine mutase [Methanoregulaceae archaeon]